MRRTASVVRLEHYRRVWRTGAACCAVCGALWEVVVHVAFPLRDVQCPRCASRGNVTISGLSRPDRLPERLRDLRGSSASAFAAQPPSAS